MWEGNLKGYTQGCPFLGGGGALIFDTPLAEEAFKFVQWLIEENEIEWALRTGQFFRKRHFTDKELLNAKPYYSDFLPAAQDAFKVSYIRQMIPEFSLVMWNPICEYWGDVLGGELTPKEAQQRWVETMKREFEEAGYYK